MKTPEGQRRVQDADERVEGAPRAGMQEPIGHGGDVGAMPFGALAEDLKFEDIATSSPTTPVVSPKVENRTVIAPSQGDTTGAQQGDQPHIHGGFRRFLQRGQ